MPTKSGAGFDKNPQNINRNGRPKKAQSMTTILAEVLGEDSVNYKGQKISGKEAIARKMLELAMAGDVPAIKYIYDRMDGAPKQTVDVAAEIEQVTPKTRRERKKRLEELLAKRS